MDKKLVSSNQSAKVALSKSKSLLKIVNSIKNNTETWKDKDTGLIWEIKSSENIDEIYTYDEAVSYVQNLNIIKFGGINNWEIPNINVLETLST